MSPKINLATLSVVFLLLSGCQNTADLERRLSEIESSVESKIEENGTVVDAAEQSMIRLTEEWDGFQKNYSPDLRTQLNENLKQTETNLQTINEVKVSAEQLLASILQVEQQCKNFRNLAEKHAEQSNDFDEIGKVESELRTLRSKISQVEASARRALTTARQAKSRAGRK